jgi:hypothetical protein
VLTHHADRIGFADVGEGAARFDAYRRALEAAGASERGAGPYAYDHYSDGTPITARDRRRYRELGAEAAGFGDPFDADGPFRAWLETDDA